MSLLFEVSWRCESKLTLFPGPRYFEHRFRRFAPPVRACGVARAVRASPAAGSSASARVSRESSRSRTRLSRLGYESPGSRCASPRRASSGASHEGQGVRNANGNARAANTNVFGKHTMWPPGSHPPLTPREVSRSPPGRRAFRRPLRTRCADFLVSTCAYVHLRPGLQR